MSDYFGLGVKPHTPVDSTSRDMREYLRGLRWEPGVREDVPLLEWLSPAPPRFDWVWNTTATRLFSSRAREVFEASSVPADRLQWLPGDVVKPAGERVRHWVMHFTEHLDIFEETVRGPRGLPMGSVISRSKVGNLRIFAAPAQPEGFTVADEVLAAIRAAGLTGFVSAPRPVA